MENQSTPAAGGSVALKVTENPLLDWINVWRPRRENSDVAGSFVAIVKEEAHPLAQLLAHYDRIVFLGYSFWRKLIILLQSGLETASRPTLKALCPRTTIPDLGITGHLRAGLDVCLPLEYLTRKTPVSPQSLGSNSTIGDTIASNFGAFFYWSVSNNQIDVVETLVRRLQIDVSQSWPLTRQVIVNVCGNTTCSPFHVALRSARGDDTRMVEHLLRKGGAALLKSTPVTGWSGAASRKSGVPLHYAAGVSTTLTELLLNLGADVNELSGYQGSNALFVAKGVPTMRLLVNRGLDVNYRNGDGGTVLHAVARDGTVDEMRFLLENGAELRANNMGYVRRVANPEVAAFLDQL